jgi:hypothetical protein
MARTELIGAIDRALSVAGCIPPCSSETPCTVCLGKRALSLLELAHREPQEPPAPCRHIWDRSLHRGCPRCAIERVEKIHREAFALFSFVLGPDMSSLQTAHPARACDLMRQAVAMAIDVLTPSEGPSPSLQAVCPPKGPARPLDGGSASEEGGSRGSL